MSRWVYSLGVGMVLVALALAFTDWALTPPFKPGVTEANARRVRPGTSLAQVQMILGGPAGLEPGGGHSIATCVSGWQGACGIAWIELFRDPRPTGVGWRVTETVGAPNGCAPSVLARLRAWLGP